MAGADRSRRRIRRPVRVVRRRGPRSRRAPRSKAPEWPSPKAPLRPGQPGTIAVAALQSGLPFDAVCDTFERKLGAAVVRIDSEELWSEDGRHALERAGRVLAVTAGGPVPYQLQGRPDLRGCDVLLLDGPAGTRGFGLWLDVLEARARHVALGQAGFDAAIARVARRMTGRSVGLVLSGGGARALAHIGVIEELRAAGIEIDRVGGTSMGAFLGALLAMGHDPEEIEARCYEEWVRRSPLTDYRLPRVSLLRGNRARAMLDRTLPGNIEALPLDFFCVTCDLVAGDLVVHRRGSLAKAVGASISIPGLVPPMSRHGRLLVDGGVLNNLPVDVMAPAHEGPIIAVDVTARVAPPSERGHGAGPARDARADAHARKHRHHRSGAAPRRPRDPARRPGRRHPRVPPDRPAARRRAPRGAGRVA